MSPPNKGTNNLKLFSDARKDGKERRSQADWLGR